MEVVRVGQLGNFLTDDSAFLQALPEDTLLARLDTAHICVALRAPHPTEAARRLHAMTSSHAMTGPRLEAMAGDGPALTAARRLVADLLLWKQGKVAWSDLSRSILLYGPPGTGKTWLARAMGNSAGIACVTGSFAEWQSAGHLGDMLREMRKTFAEARRLRPCILFIDEIDAVGSRTDGDRHGINYRTQVINGFLGEMNSLSTEEGVIVIGACNYPDTIDPAVTRAGRFDLRIELPLPDTEAILALLRQYLREDITDHELKLLARKAVGRSPAEIDAAIRAARSEARHDRKRLSIAMLRDHLKVGIDDDHPGRLRRIALHEAGHAVIGAALRLGRIERMMIKDAGGTITRTPHQSESLLSDIDAEIAYSLGGRAAERLMLGEVSAGAGGPAHSDLASATRYALDVEAVYGLGLEGPVWHETPGLMMMQNSHLKARVRQRIERAERRAGTILAANKAVLEGLAEELMRQRSMKAAGIDSWLRRVVGEEDLAPGTATGKGNTASPAIMDSRAHLPASVEAPKITPNP